MRRAASIGGGAKPQEGAQFVEPFCRLLDLVITTVSPLIVRRHKERVMVNQRAKGEIEQFEGRIFRELAIERGDPRVAALQITGSQNRKAHALNHGARPSALRLRVEIKNLACPFGPGATRKSARSRRRLRPFG